MTSSQTFLKLWWGFVVGFLVAEVFFVLILGWDAPKTGARQVESYLQVHFPRESCRVWTLLEDHHLDPGALIRGLCLSAA